VDKDIRESLVEYVLANREEIFLSYSHRREYGPGIERTGKGPPMMEDLSPLAIPWSTTTHPIGQRLCSWLIEDDLRADDLDDIYAEIAAPWFDLGLMPSVNDLGGILARGKNLIIVAAVNESLHIRIFNADGNRVVDTDETTLTGQSSKIKELKDRLGPLWSLDKLPSSDKDRVVDAVASIVADIVTLIPRHTATPHWRLNPKDKSMKDFREAIARLRTGIKARLDEDGLRDFKTDALHAATSVLVEAGKRGLPSDILRALRAFVQENPKLAAHDRHFVTTYTPNDTTKPSDFEIIGQQGCGDLTMNLWSVAYINSPLTPGGKPVLLFLHAEPIGSHTYPCLVKWKAVENNAPCVSIEDMQFNPNAARVGDLESQRHIAWVVRGGKPHPVGDQIEFAVSGKPVIRHGKLVNLGRRTRQFTDLRHLLAMANLNPKDGGPRTFFAREQYDDVWFGEAQLLDDENLQRAAMVCPVVLSRLYAGLSVSMDHLRARLEATGYSHEPDPTKDLTPGQYRFVPDDDNLIEIFFLRNMYAWNIIGVDRGAASELKLESNLNTAGDMSSEGKNEIIVASVNDGLFFRIFDADGNRIVDTDGETLLKRSEQDKNLNERVKKNLEELNKQLKPLWSRKDLSEDESDKVIDALASIVGYSKVPHKKPTKVQAFACECKRGQSGRGYELNKVADFLLEGPQRFGTHDALLFDEGDDVFQKALIGGKFPKAQIYSQPGTNPPYVNPDLDITVPLKRKRLRACFLFARPRPAK